MPLPKPILDDRSYQQLRDELVRRIPVYTKEWTDHNPSDPGITLIELFSFLGENLLFRFNQIPEATQLAFLRLLRLPMRPAVAARALVALTTDDPAGVLVSQGSPASAGKVPFETLTEVKAWPLSVLGLSKAVAAKPADGSEEGDFTQAAIDAAEVKSGTEKPAYYQNQQVAVDPSKPGVLPVDFAKSVDRFLWLAVASVPGVTDLTQLKGHLINVGFALDETIASLADVTAPCPGAGATATSPDTVWEYSTGTFDATGAPVYRQMTVEGDTTFGLTRDGTVRLKVPDDLTTLGVFPVADPDLVGTRTLPPQIADEEVAATVLFWVRAYRRGATAQPLPRVLWLGANVTEVVQTRKSRPAFLGVGNAQADQEVKLAQKPVIEGSLVLEVEEGGAFKPWQVVDGFEASTESDRHFTLDLEAGLVRFGNGLKGRAPQIGERIRALEYRSGGGADGNVPAKAIAKLDEQPTLKASNPLAARGGAEAEPIDEALDRVPAELRRRDRAVTSSDFQELALATPGGAVGRAEPMGLFHPPTKKLDAAGVVSVVVWPKQDAKAPNAPMPDRTLLRQVCQWLDARRLITTELWVIPPTYRKIAVAVGVEVKAGFGIEAVRHWAELVVRQYIAPLPPFGPEGEGWPLGRTVYARELEAAVLQVEGVRFLSKNLRLARWDAATAKWVETDAVTLAAWEVPELSEITVVEKDPLAPGEALGPPPTDQVAVPIPTLKEEC